MQGFGDGVPESFASSFCALRLRMEWAIIFLQNFSFFPDENTRFIRLFGKRQEVKTLDESVSAKKNAVQFETLYEQYASDVLRMAYFYLADRHKAEDVCQDVFVKLYTHGHTIEPGKEKAWLLRVTVNSCRDLWRGAWLKRVVLGAPTLEMIPAQDETIEKREEKEELMRAVNKLPGAFRETVLLHYYQGLGISEIAQMLDLPEGTISSRLSRARKKLEVLLKEEATRV